MNQEEWMALLGLAGLAAGAYFIIKNNTPPEPKDVTQAEQLDKAVGGNTGVVTPTKTVNVETKEPAPPVPPPTPVPPPLPPASAASPESTLPANAQELLNQAVQSYWNNSNGLMSKYPSMKNWYRPPSSVSAAQYKPPARPSPVKDSLSDFSI